MLLSALLQGIHIETDLEALCPYGLLRIYSTPERNSVLLDCADDQVFRYFLRTLSTLRGSADQLRLLSSARNADQTFQVDVAGKTLLRIGGGAYQINWPVLLRHWLSVRLKP